MNDWDDTALVPGTMEPARQGRAYLVVVRGSNVGEIYLVAGPELVIGRATGADLRLNDEGVSRFHCKLRHQPEGIVVEDLDSRNGTFCNGVRIVPGMPPLAEGDRLQIGTTSVLRFTYEETVESATPPEDQSTRDSLTNTYTRRYFVDRLQTEVEAALREGAPLALVLLHIDRFDEICTMLGQTVGDELTRSVADHILERLNETDLLARFAGGDFAMMSCGTSPGNTFMLAERLRVSTAGLSVALANGPQKVTLSLAVALVSELRIETANDLLIAADRALNRARSKGGDCVVLCTDDLLREPKHRNRV